MMEKEEGEGAAKLLTATIFGIVNRLVDTNACV